MKIQLSAQQSLLSLKRTLRVKVEAEVEGEQAPVAFGPLGGTPLEMSLPTALTQPSEPSGLSELSLQLSSPPPAATMPSTSPPALSQQQQQQQQEHRRRRRQRQRQIEPWDFVSSSPEPPSLPPRDSHTPAVITSTRVAAPATTAEPVDPTVVLTLQPAPPNENTGLHGFAAAAIPFTFAAPVIAATPRRRLLPVAADTNAAAAVYTPLMQARKSSCVCTNR